MCPQRRDAMRRSSSILLFGLIALAPLSAIGAQSSRLDSLDAFVKAQMAQRNVRGLSLAIIKDGKIVVARGYGVVDNVSKAPVTTSTLFQAGSISKPVAALGALHLVETGAQSLVADVTGQPFPRYMQTTVLDRIGMTSSSYEQPPSRARALQTATGYYSDGSPVRGKWHVYPEMAAAGLWTTPTDLAKFAIELQLALLGRSSRVLSSSAAREMITPVGVGPYAVGFAIGKQGEGWYFQHGGSNWGFQCNLVAHRIKGYGAAIMTNGDNGGALIEALTRMIQQEYAWDVLDQPIPRRYGPVS